MYINDRDQINYHGFLKALRELQGANLRHVAEGICSDSEVFRAEIGDRLPEKLMRDRITSRLGVSGEEYEEYLRPEEYRQWEIRMYILDSINKGDVEAVQKGIELYEEIPDKNPVMKQFIDAMRYMLYQMQGVSEDILRAQIELAVVHTVPDVSSAFLGVHLLADQELNLIAEYTRLREYDGPKENAFAWRLEEYIKILEYIDHSYMDTIGRSKVYPKTTCYICEWILNNSPKKKNLELALDFCVKSIELLRDASRLYYFVELLEYRKVIIKRLLKLKMDDKKRVQLETMYEKDTEWENLFKELYTEYEVPVYMQNFTYLYVETECNNAVEVIRTRRNMLKLSRVKVCDNICTEKTVERFENYTHSPSIVIVRDIFERIGLCAEYKRARVITDNAEMLRISNRLITCLNSGDIENSNNCLDILEENLSMDISFNQQEVLKHRNLINIRNKVEDMESVYKTALSALEYTIPFGAIIRTEKIYITRGELECLYDLAFKVSGEVSNACFNIIKDACEKILQDNVDVARLCVYEPLVCELASVLGDVGKYEESCKWSEKLLKECLTNRRLISLVDSLYNKHWNYEKMLKYDNESTLKRDIKRCLSIGELSRRNNWVAFLQQRIMVYDKSN